MKTEQNETFERIIPQPVYPGTTMVISCVELITPERATKILESSPGNRNIRQSTVDAYARDMQAGKWGLIGSGISIDEYGRLMDGHHRMMAVIKANTSIYFIVAHGVKRSEMNIIDRGRVRNIGDILIIDFPALKHHGKSAASMITWLIAYYSSGGTCFNEMDLRMVTPPQITNFMKKNENDVLEAVSRRYGVFTPSTIAIARFVLNRIDKAGSEMFFDLLIGGSTEGTPTRTLEKALLNIRNDKKLSGLKLKTISLAFIFKAWNFWRKGKSCHRMIWREKEKFPIPQ